MIIVFDTNVLISAFIATGTCKDIFEYIVENYEATISHYVLKEIKEKLTGKLGFSLKDYKEVEAIIKGHTTVIREKKGFVEEFADKKDIPILDLCHTCGADLLIAGDKKLLRLKTGKTKIIGPSEFWDIERG